MFGLKSSRPLQYVALLVVTTAVFTVAYNVGMATWEGRPQSLIRSFEVVVQSFTTTGYGQDAPWENWRMNVLVIAMQLAGIGLILAAINAFVVPWFRTVFQPSPPTDPVDLEEHVVICGHTPRTESFVAELEERETGYVLVEPDETTAIELSEAGMNVIHGDPASVETLERGGVERATAVVADAADEVNASIALSVREVSSEVPVLTVVEDNELGDYQRIAGANDVLFPRQLLGRSLAGRIPTAVRSDAEIGDGIELVELTLTAGNEPWSQPLTERELSERFGVSVVGVWLDDGFVIPADPCFEMEPGTRLLVAGDPDEVADLRSEAFASVRDLAPQRVLIAGYGETGSAAEEAFQGTRSRVTVLDVEEKPGVDVVGDAREPAALREAGVEDASTVIVTVADDTTAIFTTLIVTDLNPKADVFVRANHEADVRKLDRAGADDVRSLAAVSGRMMAATVFGEDATFAHDDRVWVATAPVGDLAGRTIHDADVRRRTGATVLAVERGEETITGFDPATFGLETGDELVLAGTDRSIDRFEQQFA